jgi:hypothetical protein
MEAVLGRAATTYNGSDSFLYGPDSRSKYKLLPYDGGPHTPTQDHGEGVAVCVDLGECEREFGERLATESGSVTWLPVPVMVQVGSGARTYRLALLPLNQEWEQRFVALRDLANVLRRIERTSR